MTDNTFFVIWLVSFFLYFVIYTFWIPYRTQVRIEQWLRSEDSDDTLLLSMGVIVKSIREQALHDFEEFMLPRARESLQKFWSGAMGNAVKEIGKTEEGSKLSMLSSMAQDLSGQPWYVQAMATKFLPIIENASKTQGNAKKTLEKGLGIRK
tara:strand:- start:27 stop:482 length:456 start_codon:yes stop_codon:yes gene_type:complete